MSDTDHSSDARSPEQIAQTLTDQVAVSKPLSETIDPPGLSPSPPDVQREPSYLSLLFLMASVLFLAAWFVGPRLVEEYQFASMKGKLRAEYENAATILESQPLRKVSMASQLVAHKVKPSTVSIQTRKVNEADDDRGMQRPRGELRGYGSGVIMSEDGYIVTNAHVTENAKEILVQLYHPRRNYIATEIGRDESSDIAVLKIEAEGLIPAQWGDSDELEVGSIVWAVGSPYRYEQTVTSGIISGKDRIADEMLGDSFAGPVGKARNFLQTDAAINPGNSGGPLVNAEGNVVGIVVSIYGDTFQGISFAVPSTTAKFIYEQILQSGKVVRGYLGALPREVSGWHAKRLGLPDLDGALLARVERDSPAGRAGLQRLDVVRSWNDTPIHNYNSLYRLAERAEPGSVVEVALIRKGEPYTTSVTIGELPDYSSGMRIEVQD